MKADGGGGLWRALKVPEFRALWAATAIGRAGAQIGRVALAVLAYQRTGSASVTALVYALTLVPALVGGPLLGGLADRYPRRSLIVVCGLARALLVAPAAVPAIPLPVLAALIVAAQLLESPVVAAQVAVTPDVLPPSVYRAGVAIQQLTAQLVALAGFAAGGVLVSAIGTSGSLAANAAAFAVSALIVWRGLRRRPAARARRTADGPGNGSGNGPENGTERGGFVAGLRLLLTDHRLRSLLALALLAGFHVVPEPLAAPYAAKLGVGSAAVGLLMAAIPVGNLLGVFLVARFVPASAQTRLLGPLALCASLPLLASAFFPGLVASLLLWALIGLFGAYQVTANAEFVRLTPDEWRGRLVGIASAALVAAQGLGVIAAGALATAFGVSGALLVAGAAGLAAGVPAALDWRRARTGRPT